MNYYSCWVCIIAASATLVLGQDYLVCDDPSCAIAAGADCSESPFGCCSSNASLPAHGPGDIGCCAAEEHQCCPDDIKAASGPYGEGCSCEGTEFGCCPDDTTPAKGPEMLGCGCQFSPFGCCPDSTTAASGADFEGCPCHTFEHGCCTDAIAVAKGPNLEGCNTTCNSSYGCCADGLTPKISDEDGCGCEASEFGCCPDLLTESKGPLFQGCPDAPKPQCHRPPEAGPCRNFTDKWFYDVKYGGCSRFWFGGCDPGPNHFDDEASCQNECVSPKGQMVCFLEKMTGSCQGVYNEWFFDMEKRICSPFVYSGCLGNGNRFVTKGNCEDACTSQDTLALCMKPKIEGGCHGSFERWYFDKAQGQCQPFNYSGCNGNNNRFVSKVDCENACRHMANQIRTEILCNLPILEGDWCGNATENATLPKWGYHTRLRRCVPFYYTGCGGNLNVFGSKEACEDVCPTTFAPIIRLPRGDEVLAERGADSSALHVSIRANPPAKVEWFHNGRPLSRFNPRYTISDSYLQISKVTDFDAGTYSVKAENGIGKGQPAEASIRLIVYPLPLSLSIKSDKTLFQPDDVVTLPCTVKGYPAPTIKWYRISHRFGRRNETEVVADSRVSVETYQVRLTESVSNLVIRNAQSEDSGSYKCEASSEFSRTVSDTEGIRINYGPGSTCTDRPSYAHCDLIVAYKFCGNKYYGQYCCHSCTRAGFLPGGL